MVAKLGVSVFTLSFLVLVPVSFNVGGILDGTLGGVGMVSVNKACAEICDGEQGYGLCCVEDPFEVCDHPEAIVPIEGYRLVE